MAIDMTLKNKIKSLLLKGFNKEEIKSLLSLEDDKLIIKTIKETSENSLDENSADYYSELQKDLSKLVLSEMNKDKDKKDPNVILNAIKLQAELQSKKVGISKGPSVNVSKISKKYIYDRDEEVARLIEEGIPNSEIAKKFGISEVSIGWSIDRHKLDIPEHLKVLSPTTITETMGLPKEERIRILQEAFEQDLTKLQVRDIVARIKNEVRAKSEITI